MICTQCGERAASVYSLCRTCRQKHLSDSVAATLARIGGGGAARPTAHEADPDRARAALDEGGDEASEPEDGA